MRRIQHNLWMAWRCYGIPVVGVIVPEAPGKIHRIHHWKSVDGMKMARRTVGLGMCCRGRPRAIPAS